MKFTVKQIAQYIGSKIEGNKDATVRTFAEIEEGINGAISFLSNPKYAHYIYSTQSSIILADKDLKLNKPVQTTLMRVKNTYDSATELLRLCESVKPRKTGIHPVVNIAKTAKIGENACIGPFACIGESVVIGNSTQILPHAVVLEDTSAGSECIIYPHTTIYHNCKMGSHVTLHTSSVIRADGFGFAPPKDGYDKIPQIGIVIVENDVEVGANTCVDHSTMGSTHVKKGVKLNNLVRIARNTDIGEHTVMNAQMGVAGSSKVGQWCMFGGQVGVTGHIIIGNKVFLGAQPGVPSSIKDDQQLVGTPPMRGRAYFRSQAIFQKFPELYKEINNLKEEVERLKKNIK